MADPWFKFFAADYLLDEQVDQIHLEAQGILIRLWCLCWRSGAIPDSPETLALRTKVEVKTMRKHWPVLRSFFVETSAGMVSERMEKERNESRAMTDARRFGAQKTNEKRWGKSSLSESLSDGQATNGLTIERVAERVAERSVSESESESEKDTTPTPSGPGKPKRPQRVEVLGEYPAELYQAVEHYRGLMKDCKADEVLNLYTEEKRFIAKQIGANEATWTAWKKRIGKIVHGSAVTNLDMLAAVDRLIQARGYNATKGLGLNVPMLPTLINDPVFVDALVKVKEVEHAS